MRVINGIFDRHQAKKFCDDFELPYRKPSEWLSVSQTVKLLDSHARYVWRAILGWYFDIYVYYVFLGEPPSRKIADLEEGVGMDLVRMHPDVIMEIVKKRQEKILRKEKRLLKELMKKTSDK